MEELDYTYFKKYTSIPTILNKHMNHYLDQEPHMLEQKVILTEKLHGANFGIYIDDTKVLFQSRTEPCRTNKGFFNHINVFNPEVDSAESRLISTIIDIIENSEEIENIRLYGELFGKGINKYEYNIIDEDIVNHPCGKAFKIFDMEINDKRLTPRETLDFMIKHNISIEDYYVPILGIAPSLTEALEVSLNFKSKYVSNKTFARVKDHFAEGIVIRTFASNDFIYKNKNVKFADRHSNDLTKEKHKPLSSDFFTYKDLILEFLTPARYESAFSKYGIIEEKNQIGKYIKIISNDVKSDFLSNYKEDMFSTLNHYEAGRVLDSLGNLIAQRLLEILNENIL